MRSPSPKSACANQQLGTFLFFTFEHEIRKIETSPLLFLICWGVLTLTGCATQASVMVVAVPVVDLRREPRTAPISGVHDPLEETQLLYGERVRLLSIRDGWAKVEALEQAEFTHDRKWAGYPGWVPAQRLVPSSSVWDPTIVLTEKWVPVWRDPYRTQPPWFVLPLGALLRGTDAGGTGWRIELVDGDSGWIDHTCARPLAELQALPETQKRGLILRTASQLLGDPYVWGGRSPYGEAQTDQVTGVDCSGLVNLAYRTVGLAIPRDAHEQFLKAHPVEAPQPGDLIFLSEPLNPEHITHVMLYAGDGQLIEGPGTGSAVRRIAVSQRLGRSLDGIAPGTVVGNGQSVYFGTYFE